MGESFGLENSSNSASEHDVVETPKIIRWEVTVSIDGVGGETREFTSTEDVNEYIAATSVENPHATFDTCEIEEGLATE